jgi:hypothetical protein
LAQGDRETRPNQKSEKDEDAAKNCRGYIPPSIGHSKGDAKKAEEGAGQRISQAIPVLRFVGRAKAIVQAGSIASETSYVGPRELVGGKESGGKTFGRSGAFG